MSDRARLELLLAICIGLVAIECAGGIVWMGVIGNPIPEALVAITSAAVGALAGALSASALSARQTNGAHPKSPPNPSA